MPLLLDDPTASTIEDLAWILQAAIHAEKTRRDEEVLPPSFPGTTLVTQSQIGDYVEQNGLADSTEQINEARFRGDTPKVEQVAMKAERNQTDIEGKMPPSAEAIQETLVSILNFFDNKSKKYTAQTLSYE